MVRVILLFLLVFSSQSRRAEAGWSCPQISHNTRALEISCSCEISHTLRCDGASSGGSEGPLQLRRLVKEVSSLPPENRVTLLDISVRNITRLQSKLFHSLGLKLSGLVISTGSLSAVDRKAFTGLEKSLNALGLPDNNLTTIPVTCLSNLLLLSRLDLSGNKVSTVTTLPKLPELEYLDLSRNNISLLAWGWAQTTPNLRTLLLTWNRLNTKSLSQGDLQHLTYLQHLDISHNNMTGNLTRALVSTVCPAGVKTLDMSFNGLMGITALAFSRLSSLTSLSLAGNRIDLIEDNAFSGLDSLISLDLSHNNILTLSTDSLAGLLSLASLSLGHNYLQVVSTAWLYHLTNLTSLLVMDNDISSVEDGALDSLSRLVEINLAGNLVSCDCGVSYLYTYLHSPTSNLTELSLHSAVCATPPSLTNAPLYQLPASPGCDPTTSDLPGDYYYTYEYYSENTTEQNLATLLSSQELHFQEAWFDSITRQLHLTWKLEEDGLTYTCGQLHVFEEREAEGVVNLSNEATECELRSSGEVSLTVSLASLSPSLLSDRPYIFCLSLHQGDLVLPGCSGAVTADMVASHHQPEVRITSLQGNVSLTHNISVTVSTRVPDTMRSSCTVSVSVALPGEPPISVEKFKCGASSGDSGHLEAVMSNIPAHSYYNVCAQLSLLEVEADRQCMILHTSTIVRYQTRSVLSLLLTLIFLSLGIACLTVFYLIVRHRAGPRARPRPHHGRSWPAIIYSLAYWWRRATHNKNKLVEDFSDDEGI